MVIDLHTHSTASDGTDSPAGLVRAASSAGVDVLAITDHDTTSGWAEAAEQAAQLDRPLTLVRGMELSCVGPGEDGDPVAVHVLGYLFDPEHPAFAAERVRLREERATRLRAIGAKLRDDGIDVDIDRILADAGPSAGRPHLARALIERGVVATMDEAFDGPLRTGGPYYVAKRDTPIEDGIDLITESGGVAVIAHVRARRRGSLLATSTVEQLARDGRIGGLEVDHPDHEVADAEYLRALADRHGLVVTGSSDYHGTNKSTQIAARTTAPEQFAELVRRASGVPVLWPHS